MTKKLGIIIRKAKREELSRVSYVTNIAYKSPFTENGIVTKPHKAKELEDDFLNKRVGILVAFVSGKIIGVQKYKKINNNNLYIYQLAVLKSHRGKGMGAKLLEETEKIARKENFKKITLDCMKEKHLPEYYAALGFKVDEIKKHKDYHMVYMSKKV